MFTALARAGRYLQRWVAAHPALCATVVLFASFYLYLTGQWATEFPYDAADYWRLAGKYYTQGDFYFLGFNDLLRGYLFPLLLTPLFRLAQPDALPPMEVFRPVGAALAALLFGVVGPGLWQATQAVARPVPVGRRLVFGVVGFALWHDYFNYPLTDFPALLALAAGLWAVAGGRSVGRSLVAGVLVAAAANFRPVYVAAVPLVGLLGLWPRTGTIAGAARTGWAFVRGLSFVAGMAAVCWPQAVINKAHFGVSSPLVLTTLPKDPSLYLVQLGWGLNCRKYETSIGHDYPIPQLIFTDPRGQEIWNATGLKEFTSYAQYIDLAAHEPLGILRVWLGHLFNGLDVQYPEPYVQAVYVPTWKLAALNYTVLLAGIAVLALRARRGNWRQHGRAAGVAAALLLPCLATLPTAMECRFLLPLHLLLSAAAVFGVSLAGLRRQSARQWVVGVLLYGGGMFALFSLSANTQRRLQYGPRELFGPPSASQQSE